MFFKWVLVSFNTWGLRPQTPVVPRLLSTRRRRSDKSKLGLKITYGNCQSKVNPFRNHHGSKKITYLFERPIMESIVDCNGAVSSRKFGPSQIKEQPMKEVDIEMEEKKICNIKCFQMGIGII
jgi:hypothetical protein